MNKLRIKASSNPQLPHIPAGVENTDYEYVIPEDAVDDAIVLLGDFVFVFLVPGLVGEVVEVRTGAVSAGERVNITTHLCQDFLGNVPVFFALGYVEKNQMQISAGLFGNVNVLSYHSLKSSLKLSLSFPKDSQTWSKDNHRILPALRFSSNSSTMLDQYSMSSSDMVRYSPSSGSATLTSGCGCAIGVSFSIPQYYSKLSWMSTELMGGDN